VFTVSGVTDLTLFLDGVPTAATVPVSSTFTGSVLLGWCRPCGAAPGQGYEGQLAQVALYPRVLSQAEVSAHLAAAKVGAPAADGESCCIDADCSSTTCKGGQCGAPRPDAGSISGRTSGPTSLRLGCGCGAPSASQFLWASLGLLIQGGRRRRPGPKPGRAATAVT
jgi:hypothetical protein